MFVGASAVDLLFRGKLSVYCNKSKFLSSPGYSMADSSESKPTLFGEDTIADKFWKVTSSLFLMTRL